MSRRLPLFAAAAELVDELQQQPLPLEEAGDDLHDRLVFAVGEAASQAAERGDQRQL
jgi:hypothetical protein